MQILNENQSVSCYCGIADQAVEAALRHGLSPASDPANFSESGGLNAGAFHVSSAAQVSGASPTNAPKLNI